jgi:hypothetical protein
MLWSYSIFLGIQKLDRKCVSVKKSSSNILYLVLKFLNCSLCIQYVFTALENLEIRVGNSSRVESSVLCTWFPGVQGMRQTNRTVVQSNHHLLLPVAKVISARSSRDLVYSLHVAPWTKKKNTRNWNDSNGGVLPPGHWSVRVRPIPDNWDCRVSLWGGGLLFWR